VTPLSSFHSFEKFVIEYANFLKKTGKIELPAWVDIVKTAAFKEHSPYNKDWFYIRCAAVARNVYLRPGTGVGALNEKFGGRRNGGYAPYHHADASGSVQRKVLQQLEKAGVLVQDSKKGGRRVTPQGQKDMDLIAKKIKTA
jgi:small subunit ribosomal protein S19e